MKWNDDAFTIRRYIGIGGLLASAVGLALIMRFTVAYLGDTTEPRVNTLNVGYADVSIVETFNELSELKMLNENITKQVKVQNNSTVPAFVRVYAEFSDSELAAKAKVKYGSGEYSWSEFKRRLNYSNPNFTGDGEALKSSKWRYVPTDNTENGTKLGGYFYYTDSLTEYKPAVGETAVEGQTTEALFDSVTIDYRSTKTENGNQVPDDQDSNIDRIQPLEMIIYSELVQVIDTGRSAVTTKTVDNNGDLVPATEEGGTAAGNPVESSRYGYNFSDDVYGNKEEWEDAWKRFLYKTNRTPTETVNPNNNEPEP